VFLRGKWISAATIEREREKLKQRLVIEHKLVVAIDERLENGDAVAARKMLSEHTSGAPLLDEWVLLTKARKQEGQLPAAINIAKLYTEQFPDRFSSHQLLADLLQKSSDNRNARAEAERALQLQPHCSTSELILQRADLSKAAPQFFAGDFRLQFEPQSDTPKAVFLLYKNGGSWSGSLKMGNDVVPIRTIVAGADQFWFKVGQDWQEKEVRLTISADGAVSGSWWSNFGRNGVVTGDAIKH
jgi:hypothetical protein